MIGSRVRSKATAGGQLRSLWKRLRRSDTAIGISLALIVGILAGLGSVLFRWLIKAFQWVFFCEGTSLLHFLGDYYVIILPAIGGLLLGPIVYFIARETKGDGPPEVMEALTTKGGRIRARVAAVKTLASSICIGSGGSVGREGPIIQIGSAIGSSVGQLFRLPENWVKTLLLCGVAGGVSATFNAPIGGVFFALEVVQRRFAVSNLGFVAISSVAADLVAYRFLGDTPSFTIPAYKMASYWEMIPYVFLGILCGLLAVGFVRFFYKCEDILNVPRIPPYIKPVLGGVAVGLIGFIYPDIFGVGYGGAYVPGGAFVSEGAVDGMLVGKFVITTLLVLIVAKIVATSLCLGSGGSGGTFAPALFIGAALGGAFGIVIHRLFPAITAGTVSEASGAYALVGMGAFFAAVVHGPITAIIILFEMTRNYSLILPLMTAVVFAMLVARGLSRESIYTFALARRGVDVQREEGTDILDGVTVQEAMTHDFLTVLPSMPLPDLIDKFHQTGHHGFPIVDQSGMLRGVVTLQDVEMALSRGRMDSLTALDIGTKSLIVAYPDQSVRDALAQLGGRDVGRIPVVARDDPRRLLGVLRRRDVVSAYTKTIADHDPPESPNVPDITLRPG